MDAGDIDTLLGLDLAAVEHFADDVGVRGMLGFTGTYEGRPISVMAVSYTHLVYF